MSLVEQAAAVELDLASCAADEHDLAGREDVGRLALLAVPFVSLTGSCVVVKIGGSPAGAASWRLEPVASLSSSAP